MKARIIVGSNYGDEGKGTVTAKYAKSAEGSVLNILTNGGAQRGHSVLTKNGSITYQHFGSATHLNADNYYSCFFILNPMQFRIEYNSLIVKPKIMRDKNCRWSTPYDMMANAISEEQKGTHATCGMGIWNTIKRYRDCSTRTLDEFVSLPVRMQLEHLHNVKSYYERTLRVPTHWRDVWDSDAIVQAFLSDCKFLADTAEPVEVWELKYDNLLFENGQGLLLSDTGFNTYDTTPSNTGIAYALSILNKMGAAHIDGTPNQGTILTAHYVTRPYLTRHGDGGMLSESLRSGISSSVDEDRTNHWNEFQGEFRYGHLDINKLKERIEQNALNVPYVVEVTHCDEMDRVSEFKKAFKDVNITDTPLV